MGKRKDVLAAEQEKTAKVQARLDRELARFKAARLREVRNLYEGATAGRRATGWRRGNVDANAENGTALTRLREVSRDLIRNNAYARRAKMTIQNNVVGSGIVPRLQGGAKSTRDLIKRHFETTAIDVRGRRNLYGLQNLVMGMVVESGECIIRFRPRRREDNLPLPFQLQVLEADYLDDGRNGATPNGNIIIQGVEYDLLGRIVAYYLFPQHPGSLNQSLLGGAVSQRVDAAFVAHIFRDERDAETARGVPWMAPVILRMRDFADFTDAQLVRQKIAACFAAFITDDGATMNEGVTGPDDGSDYPVESFEPGMIQHLKVGESVTFANPPGVAEFGGYAAATLREIAAGLGITYEAMTGDLTGVNYSSGRMGWLEYQRNIDAWRWTMLIPQFLDRLTDWTNNALATQGALTGRSLGEVTIAWTPPRREMIDPTVELEAATKAIRSGLSSRSEEVRRFGYDPEEMDAEIKADNDRADKLGLVFDSDARRVADNGRWQQGSVGEPVQPGKVDGENTPAAPAPTPAP